MKIEQSIRSKIEQQLRPEHLEVLNESSSHNVPPGSESHFKVTLVTADFEGKMLIARHRMLNELLADELAGPVHALSLHTLTPQEWAQRSGAVADSPDCLGGSKR